MLSRYVHLPPYPREFEPPELDGVKPLLKITGKSIEDGFQVIFQLSHRDNFVKLRTQKA
jgi:hypothetical protein